MKVVFCMTSDFNYDQRMQRIVSTFRKSHQIIILNRGTSSHRSFKSVNVNCFFNSGFIFYLEFNLRMLLHLIFNKYKIVYLVDSDTLLAGGVFSLFSKRKFIFDSHELYTEVPELKNKKLKKWIWKSIEKCFIKRMDLCITVNESLADYLCNTYNKPFYSIRNIPILREKIPSTESLKIILYQGALNEGRGLECAIEAMFFLEGFVLHLYGDGDIKTLLAKKVQENNLESKVFFMGKQLPEELWVKSCSAYIGLNLLENKSKSYYYSLANKFFDYMHADVPSINMDFPEYKKLLTTYETGITISALDPNLLADKIMTLDNEGFRNHLIQNCIRSKEIFNWQKEETKLIAIINEL